MGRKNFKSVKTARIIQGKRNFTWYEGIRGVELYVHSLGSSAVGEVDAVWPTSCPGLFILRKCLSVPLHRRWKKRKISCPCWKSTIKTDYFVNFSSVTQGGQAIVRRSRKNKQHLKVVILGPHTR